MSAGSSVEKKYLTGSGVVREAIFRQYGIRLYSRAADRIIMAYLLSDQTCAPLRRFWSRQKCNKNRTNYPEPSLLAKPANRNSQNQGQRRFPYAFSLRPANQASVT